MRTLSAGVCERYGLSQTDPVVEDIVGALNIRGIYAISDEANWQRVDPLVNRKLNAARNQSRKALESKQIAASVEDNTSLRIAEPIFTPGVCPECGRPPTIKAVRLTTFDDSVDYCQNCRAVIPHLNGGK